MITTQSIKLAKKNIKQIHKDNAIKEKNELVERIGEHRFNYHINKYLNSKPYPYRGETIRDYSIRYGVKERGGWFCDSPNALEELKRIEQSEKEFRDYYAKGKWGHGEYYEHSSGSLHEEIQNFRRSDLAKEIQDFCMPELEGEKVLECVYYISEKQWIDKVGLTSEIEQEALKRWGRPFGGSFSDFKLSWVLKEKKLIKRYNREKKVYGEFYMPLYGIPRNQTNPKNLMDYCGAKPLKIQYKNCLEQIQRLLNKPKEEWDKLEIRRITYCLETEGSLEFVSPEEKYPPKEEKDGRTEFVR
tara:strand:- start:40 stop:942 length:903 start_codon:yes stop_codon:yes gene_type:complete